MVYFSYTGIRYNHGSPTSGYEFLTRKIPSTVARIHAELDDYIELGNIDAVRELCYTPEYVRALWVMHNADMSDDYVIATDVLHNVREFLDIALSVVRLNYQD